MSIISSETIADNHTQVDGRRRVTHYFTDHTGGITKRGPHKVAGTDTEVEYAALRATIEPAILNQLAENEIQDFLTRISINDNPFRDELNNPVNPDHQPRMDAIRKCLRHIGKLRGSDLLEYKAGFSILNNLTQQQLEAVFPSVPTIWTRYQTWKTYAQSLIDADAMHINLDDSE